MLDKVLFTTHEANLIFKLCILVEANVVKMNSAASEDIGSILVLKEKQESFHKSCQKFTEDLRMIFDIKKNIIG